jgi:hypothetical protein
VAITIEDHIEVWNGVAGVKKYGYKIDGITSYAMIDEDGDNQLTVLVVMSK